MNNFIQKTYNILQEKKHEGIVGWNDSAPPPSSGLSVPPQSKNGQAQAPTSQCNSFRIYDVRAFE